MYQGYTGYGAAKAGRDYKKHKQMTDLLTQPTQQQGSERDIANLLAQRAMSRRPTGIVDGIASLGEAFLARGAINRADKAEQAQADAQAKQQQEMAQLLMQSGDYTPQQQALIASGAPGVTEMLTEQAFAPDEFGVTEDAHGRPIIYSKTTGEAGDAIGGVAPETLADGAMAYDPVTGEMLAENPEDAPQWKDGEQALAERRVAAQEANAGRPRNGITIAPDGTVQIGGTIGGTGSKGKEPAVISSDTGEPVVSPSVQQKTYNQLLSTNKSIGISDDIVLEDVDRALALTEGDVGEWFTTGFIGQQSTGIAGTPAHDLNKLLDTIKANIGFDKLQQMRDNSPTGGALGQVSEWELVLLQSVLGSLEQSQSLEQFRYNLNRLKEVKANMATMREEAFALDYPDLVTQQGFVGEAQSQIEDITGMSDEDLDAAIAALGGGG